MSRPSNNEVLESLAKMTVQDISQHLHSLQADARKIWGDEYHSAHVWNGEVIPCDNCDGGLAKAKYCYEYHLQKLIVSKNGPGYVKENS